MEHLTLGQKSVFVSEQTLLVLCRLDVMSQHNPFGYAEMVIPHFGGKYVIMHILGGRIERRVGEPLRKGNFSARQPSLLEVLLDPFLGYAWYGDETV